jgi:hypothetical protein
LITASSRIIAFSPHRGLKIMAAKKKAAAKKKPAAKKAAKKK